MVAYVDNGNPNGAGPVMFFQGGPGVSAVNRAHAFLDTGFDVILFDQRGTGESRPKLSCPEVDELWGPLPADFAQTSSSELVKELARTDLAAAGEELVFQAYEHCAARLAAEGIELDAFHTQAVADDADIVRLLLGFERWSVWGASYGSRVAQVVMRDHGQDLRGAVLDAVVPFGEDFFGSIPVNALRSIDALDAACEVDQCAIDHGDFGDALAGAVGRLDASPMVITVTRPVTGEVVNWLVDGSELMNMVFTQLYSTSRLTALPRQVSRAQHGGVNEMLTNYVQRRDPDAFDLASGVYYSTWCREEYPNFDAATDDEAMAEGMARYGEAFDNALGVESVARLCSAFDVPAAPDSAMSPVTSELPTLVLAGKFDPITPPAWARRVADGLPNSTFVELSDHGHGAVTSCPIQLRLAFLSDPTGDLDLSCVEEMGPPDFE